MKPVLVGSAALWNLGIGNPPKDYDFFTDEEMPNELCGRKVESFYHPGLEQWDWKSPVTLDELYTLKVSHIFWNNRWVKHAKGLILMQEAGAVLVPELYDILYPIWVEHYGEKKASLKRGTKAEEFFLPNVQRKYEHDSVHASVAYYDAPLFNRVLQDGEAVAVSWRKFEALSETDKLRLVREEIYATALERKIIPSDYRGDSTSAYRWALQATITSFWKGRWAKYAAENLYQLVTPEIDYVKKHLDNKNLLVLNGA